MSRQQRPFGSHVHTFNYFVMSYPILRSFSFLKGLGHAILGNFSTDRMGHRIN